MDWLTKRWPRKNSEQNIERGSNTRTPVKDHYYHSRSWHPAIRQSLSNPDIRPGAPCIQYSAGLQKLKFVLNPQVVSIDKYTRSDHFLQILITPIVGMTVVVTINSPLLMFLLILRIRITWNIWRCHIGRLMDFLYLQANRRIRNKKRRFQSVSCMQSTKSIFYSPGNVSSILPLSCTQTFKSAVENSSSTHYLRSGSHSKRRGRSAAQLSMAESLRRATASSSQVGSAKFPNWL